MIFVAFSFMVLAGVVSLAEAYYEQDWPRDTYQFFAAFALLTIVFANL